MNRSQKPHRFTRAQGTLRRLTSIWEVRMQTVQPWSCLFFFNQTHGKFKVILVLQRDYSIYPWYQFTGIMRLEEKPQTSEISDTLQLILRTPRCSHAVRKYILLATGYSPSWMCHDNLQGEGGSEECIQDQVPKGSKTQRLLIQENQHKTVCKNTNIQSVTWSCQAWCLYCHY